MDPASALIILQALLKALPLAMQQVQIFRERGEYSDEEWNAVKADVQSHKTDPAWQVEPDPDQTGSKPKAA